MSRTILIAVAVAWWCSLVDAHTVITYPGWRGNNLATNGTNPDGSIPAGSLGINNLGNGTVSFPYGMQWMYPCGGMPTSNNRTKWPVTGGALGWQPGWFAGHKTAFMFVNLGLGNEPLNMSNNMVPVFSINGPSDAMYPGSICLPQVPLPANVSVNVGDNATIQVVELAQHGAALYSCVDITFSEPEDVAQVNGTNCANTTGADSLITFDLVFATSDLSTAVSSRYASVLAAVIPTLVALICTFSM
ncbi:Endothiapepsin precursor protein [Neofusicoccum parvum]|nr:Endothiapepsin precursor protein [Neofusicoccum parvum]